MARYKDLFESSRFKLPSPRVSSAQIRQASRDASSALDSQRHDELVGQLKDIIKRHANGGKFGRRHDDDGPSSLFRFNTRAHEKVREALDSAYKKNPKTGLHVYWGHSIELKRAPADESHIVVRKVQR